jgi:hypothetical protein
MNVNLTAEQLQAVKDGTMVHLSVPEFEMECVVVRADLCGRIGAVIENTVGDVDVAFLVESSMREYDEHDPSLESYQKYRTG